MGEMVRSTASDTDNPTRNAEVNWDGFNSDVYYTENYRSLLEMDRRIITIIRDFFAGAGLAPSAEAVDVGTGTNLYPAMALLPFCARLTLIEFAEPNVKWLCRQKPYFDPAWDEFWQVYAENEAYARVAYPRLELAGKTDIRKGSVFNLPARRWDCGTMFFVACSLSRDIDEFHQAVRCFTGALRPDAPFAAAFMEGSQGYPVADLEFPAVDIGTDQVKQALAPVAYDVGIVRIPVVNKHRDGYKGMIVATGRVADVG